MKFEEQDSLFARWYQRWVLRHGLFHWLLILCAAVYLALQIPGLKFDASSEALVLEGDPTLREFRQLVKRYGSSEFLVVTFTPNQGSVYDDANLNLLKGLKRDLLALQPVSSINSILDVPLLYSPPLTLHTVSTGIRYLQDGNLDKRLVADEFRTSPIYENLLTNGTGTTTALQVNLARDEHFFELLNRRNELRENRDAADAEPDTLAQAEAEFRAYADTSALRQRAMVDDVRAILDKYRPQAEIFLGGVPMITTDMIRFINNDLLVFGSAIILFTIALLAFFFRRLRWVMLPFLTVCIVVAGMLGALVVADFRLTVISSNFVALLMIMTLSMSIHLVVRYREANQQQPHTTTPNLASQTARAMWLPCVYTALTTIVAFASLMTSGIRPVIDFGWMMTLGMSAALLLSFILIPAGMALLKPLYVVQRRDVPPALTWWFARAVDRHGHWVLIMALVLALLSGWGVSRLEVDNRFIDFFDDTTEIYQGMETIDQELGGTIPLEIILKPPANYEFYADRLQDQNLVAEFGDNPIAGNPFAEPDFGDDPFLDDAFAGDVFADDSFDDEFKAQPVNFNPLNDYWFTGSGLRHLEDIHDGLSAYDETGKVFSLATFYKVVRDIAGGTVDELQLSLIKQNVPPAMESNLIQPYFDPVSGETRINLRVKETHHGLHHDHFIKQIRQDLIEQYDLEPEQVQLSGLMVLYNNMLQSLFDSQIKTLGTVLAAIFVMFMLLFRSVLLAIIGILPNALAAAIVLGGMGLAGLPLDMMTITIAAITIGIGVDDAIHYLHRFRAEFMRDRNYRAAMYRSHASIGRAMYYTSVTIVLGFAIFSLSNFKPSVYFGLLTGFAMISALMGALLLLPKLMMVMKPLGPERIVD